MAKILTFGPRPTRDPLAHVAVHHQPDPVELVEVRAPSARQMHPTNPCAPVGPFDWALQPDQPLMPTLVACALDRLGQYVQTPGLVSREQAIEALFTIRSHYRPDTEGPEL